MFEGCGASNVWQKKAVGLASDGGQWLEDFIIEPRRRWSQRAESSSAISVDGRSELTNISDEIEGGDLAGTAIVLEAVCTAFHEQVLLGGPKRLEQDRQVTQFGGLDE